jgi:hypothetical protein
MATRQRGRASTKTATPTSGTQQAATETTQLSRPTAIEVPHPITENVGLGERRPTAASEVKFVGEQLTYKTRYERIAESAYGYAQARGFAPGGETEDWLRAEREIDALLAVAGVDGGKDRID